MNLGLKDCKVFIAGASKGLGKACAKALADEGARVFICARNKQALKQAASEFGAAGYSAADVSLLAEVKLTALGGLDCLVTNGGPPTAPFERASDEDWDSAYKVNLMSAVRLIREALPALKSSGRGRIVNLTGYGVKEPLTDLVVSDSIRAGVTVMAKTIAPDPIMTDRITEILAARAKSSGVTPQEQLERLADTVPVRRIGQPHEVGDL